MIEKNGEEELAPCPFCGRREAFVEQLDISSSMVVCSGRIDEYSACLARGPVGIQDDDGESQPGHAAAIREWNQRSQLQITAYEGGAGVYKTKMEAVRNGEQLIEPVYLVKP